MIRHPRFNRQHDQVADIRSCHVQADDIIALPVEMDKNLPDKAFLVFGIDRKDSWVGAAYFFHNRL